MPLTSNSDVMGRFHESAFNTIFDQYMLQTPKTFNYASKKVIDGNRFCSPIKVDPILDSMGIQKVTEVPPLPLVGASPHLNVGIEYCVQIKDLVVDFNPSSAIQLPQELGGLALQQFAIKGTVCAGIGCNQIGTIPYNDIDILIPATKFKIKNLSKKNSKKAPTKSSSKKASVSGLSFLPMEYLKMNCFCLSLYGKVVIVRENNFLKLKLVGIELEDISPLGLENSIECYLKQMLDHVVFPKLKMAIGDLVFEAGSYFNIGLTSVSSSLPYNPDVSNNYFSIFLNIN